MEPIRTILLVVCYAIVTAVMARALCSFFPTERVRTSVAESGHVVVEWTEIVWIARAQRGLRWATEWLLGPLRRIFPPIGSRRFALEVGPVIVLLALQLVVIPALEQWRH